MINDAVYRRFRKGDRTGQRGEQRQLTATNQGHDFNLIAVLKHAICVLFSGHQTQVSFHCAVAIIDLQMLQQVANGPVLLNAMPFSVDLNINHGPVYHRKHTLEQ